MQLGDSRKLIALNKALTEGGRDKLHINQLTKHVCVLPTVLL